ncbi:hypothetical protein [Paenibacillus xanthanilyticus]|uniref:Uncharacterized protein n=1 Tax=Paenibacillus xanthanilyticus TaxID=1783531 RepID=A0ABV8K137_9BACL
MTENEKSAEQQPKAEKEVELRDLEQELTDAQKREVEGGWGTKSYRPRIRGC